MFKCSLHAIGIGVVAHDQGDFNLCELFIFDSIDESLQVAATAGNENTQAQGMLRSLRRFFVFA